MQGGSGDPEPVNKDDAVPPPGPSEGPSEEEEQAAVLVLEQLHLGSPEDAAASVLVSMASQPKLEASSSTELETTPSTSASDMTSTDSDQTEVGSQEEPSSNRTDSDEEFELNIMRAAEAEPITIRVPYGTITKAGPGNSSSSNEIEEVPDDEPMVPQAPLSPAEQPPAGGFEASTFFSPGTYFEEFPEDEEHEEDRRPVCWWFCCFFNWLAQ